MPRSDCYRNETTYVIRRNVTDRALRYRAVRLAPAGPKVCAYCGSRRNVEVDHVDGFEDHNTPENLVWACRRCNTAKGALFARMGKGRKTRQFNPSDGATSYEQYVLALEALHGKNNLFTVPAAVELIHSTPMYRRKMFAQQIWARRRERGTDKTGVPF